MTSPLKTRQLQLSDALSYELYKAALEWGLIEPIIIQDRADIRSEPGWRELIEPYNHQISNLISFCRRLPVTLLADDVGLGKTISAGLVASELMSRGRVSKILIVCPKLIIPQWEEELKTKFGINSVSATGIELLEAAPPEGKGAVITTYNSARLYLNAIAKSGFDLLILDEAHKLRNLYGTDKQPQVARRFQKVLGERVFKYVLMLTATPIQNRLWDIYSLMELLAVARGHQNPFGSAGMFARRYIEGDRQTARRLKLDKQEEFRAIVYGHMSRMRRADARLSFPERVVQQHGVKPTDAEFKLISLIADPIQRLNRLAQISIAQALVSSPHALAAQLENMAEKGTIPRSLAVDVRSIADSTAVTAKQRGLEALVAQLIAENPLNWRMVVFTTRKETQTTIEDFLSRRGIVCGIINGDSGSRNRETVEKFRKSPPGIHVIVSTEAGSEGINLQAANVVVNYDLPWNPMVVEQRIGRVQRLASAHAKVCVFNVVLSGTFEEYIVGRLVEKLQMASHAIGDVEALLSAAGIDEEEEFAEKIRELVVAALAGKDISQSIQLQEKSIAEAKAKLEREEQNINSLLGGSTGREYSGPKSPKLPKQTYSMDLETFVDRMVTALGGKLTPKEKGQFLLELDDLKEVYSFDVQGGQPSKRVFGPGCPEFERLVSRVANVGRHAVEDLDRAPLAEVERLAAQWVATFGSSYQSCKVDRVFPCFEGTALLRARVTVAHDSLERLVEVSCSPSVEEKISRENIEALPRFIFNPEELGVSSSYLLEKVKQEEGVAEFCRFYCERLKHEVQFSGGSDRLKKKLEDDFTPRLQIELVGFSGRFFRRIDATVAYSFENTHTYRTALRLVPLEEGISSRGLMEKCAQTGKLVPGECLGTCSVSSQRVMSHLLKRSEVSGRMALPGHFLTCAISGKQLLADEAETSAVSSLLVDKSLLKKSAVSGKFAESKYFGRCEMSGVEALLSELLESQVSRRKFRADEQIRSSVSGKIGHISESLICPESGISLFVAESELCEVTGKRFSPATLATCAVSGKRAAKRLCVVIDLRINKAA